MIRDPSYAQYRHILRNDLCGFIHRSFRELNPQTEFQMNWHIELMVQKLIDCMEGRIRRLIINIPPRHLKSICASVAFPAFWLGHEPSKQILCVSYGQDLADKMARDCRMIMMSPFYKALFDTRLSSEKLTVEEYVTTEMGYRLSSSIGGVLTGRGADVIIIDDPMKPEDTLSEDRRKRINECYDNTLYSRLNDKENGCIIIIMQRLHEDDLVGHVLAQEFWEVVSFPAIAEEDTEHIIRSPFGQRLVRRQKGDALHPARESLTTLAMLRKTLGEYNFVSQYQQAPIPEGGAMVKKEWLKYYAQGEQPAKFDQIIQSWDTANKVSELADYSACTTWGVVGAHCYLLNVLRRQLTYPDLKRAVRQQRDLYRPNIILIEDKASGTQLIQELKSEGLWAVKPYAPPPGADKTMRLHAQTAAIEGGFLHLPKEAPWLADYIRELTAFPGGKYDDQVDSTTQFLAWLSEWLSRPKGIFGSGLLAPRPTI